MYEAELSEGVSIEEIDDDTLREFHKHQKGFKADFVRFQPSGQVFPRCFSLWEKKIREFEVFEDDVWIGSFPKCGTTWTEEMVWCIMNDLDYDTAKKNKLDDRIPYFELSAVCDPVIWTEDQYPDSMKATLALTQRPRLIKTHLAFDMLPDQLMKKRAKLVYVTRNPRDTCVSFFNHWKVLEGFDGSFELFVDIFLKDIAGYYTPFFDNVLKYWEKRQESNICFITYEEMKRDLPAVIRRVSAFLGKPVAEEDIPALADHLSFDKMKKNDAVNKSEVIIETNKTFDLNTEKTGFMRKGQTGNWRKHLTEDMVERFEAWEQKWLKDSDFKPVFDI